MANSSVTLVLDTLRKKLTQLNPGISTVYSPELSYSDAVKRWRTNNNVENKNSPKQLPLFAYTRSPLRPASIQGRRFPLARHDTGNSVKKVRYAFSEFDLRFAFYFNKVSEAELFELYYSTDLYGENSSIDLDLSRYNLGSIRYVVQWRPELDDLTLSTDENSFTSLSGSATILGPFVMITDEDFEVITEIDTKIYDESELVSHFTIQS